MDAKEANASSSIRLSASSSSSMSALPRGLRLLPGFISATEEQQLLELFEAGQWQGDGQKQRQVQQYGGAVYDYKAHRVSTATTTSPPLPRLLVSLVGDRLVSAGIVERLPDHVFVNKYVHHQGIAAHVDSRDFGGTIVSLSLGSVAALVYRRVPQPDITTSSLPLSAPPAAVGDVRESDDTVVVQLEPRTLLVMSDESRYGWTHEIPFAKVFRWTDRSGQRRELRRPRDYRRLAVTMRHVPLPSGHEMTRTGAEQVTEGDEAA